MGFMSLTPKYKLIKQPILLHNQITNNKYTYSKTTYQVNQEHYIHNSYKNKDKNMQIRTNS